MMLISVLLEPPGRRQITQTFFPNSFLPFLTTYTSPHASSPIDRWPEERAGRQSCRWIMMLGRIWRGITTCLIEMNMMDRIPTGVVVLMAHS